MTYQTPDASALAQRVAAMMPDASRCTSTAAADSTTGPGCH